MRATTRDQFFTAGYLSLLFSSLPFGIPASDIKPPGVHFNPDAVSR